MNEISATVALDGDTRRCCNNPDCNNVWPCKLHPDNSGGRVMMTAEQLRKPTFERKVSVERAELAMTRLINSHFRSDSDIRPHARITIPVNQDNDDIVVFDFIAQAAAQLAEKEREIAGWKSLHEDAFNKWNLAAKDRDVANLRAEAAEQRLQEYRDACGDLSPTDLEKLLDKQFEGMGLNQLTDLVEDIPTIVDLAERLRQREAELEQRWIAVGERLPDEPQHDVLLWTADDWEGGKNFQQVGVIGEFNRDEWDRKVTHWQPLPSPPKVQP